MTLILPPDAHGLQRAAELLAAGKLVAFPTETVYGLGASAADDKATARVFEAKGRPQFNPLIAHVPDAARAWELAAPTQAAILLARAFWPGPLTMVLPLVDGAPISPLVVAGGDSIAVRVPGHPVARALLTAFGAALAAPSANPSGRVSPTTAAHVMAGLEGRIDAIIDGGRTDVGLESTILDLRGAPALLRAGGTPVEAIEHVLGAPLAKSEAAHNGPLPAPGMLSSHYAPKGQVRLNATAPLAGETMLGFGDVPGDLTLSPSGDLTEAAARLFACLHTLDARGAAHIAVAPIPEEGLGRAINDRLRRAAAPR